MATAPTTPTATASEKAAWFDLLGKWRKAASDFEQAQAWLASQASFMAAQSPAIRAEYQDKTQKAATLKARIMQVSGALRSVESWLKGAYTSVVQPWERAGVSIREWLGLGAVPALIPFAVVGAALAAVSYFLVDFAKYRTKLTELRRLQEQGYTPEQAAAMLERIEPKGILGGMQGVLLAGALLALVIFVLPRMRG